MTDQTTAEFKPGRISDAAIIVAFGWFSFGAKATVTSRPPHANMKARQGEPDELVAAGLITHEHVTSKYGHDDHIFKGTKALQDLMFSDHAKAVLKATLETRND